jgi:ActR/RegA family two-component response regulator
MSTSKEVNLISRADQRSQTGLPVRSRDQHSKKTIVLGPVPQAMELESLFVSRGWDVLLSKTGKEARKLAIKNNASFVVLPVRCEPESGWLSCVKLTRSGKKVRVVLVGGKNDEEAERFALFAGASAYFSNESSAETILGHMTRSTVKPTV